MTHQPHHPQPGGQFGIQPSRPQASLLIILIGGLVVIAGGVVVLLVMNRGSPPPTPPPQQAGPVTPPPAPAGPSEPELPKAARMPPPADVKATAEDMIDKYTTAEKAAEKSPESALEHAAMKAVVDSWQGKVIEVTGPVFGKSDSDLVGYVISLAGGVEHTRGVRCMLAPENKNQLDAISKGQIAVIRGRCERVTKDMKDIELKDCAVISIKNGE